MIRVHRPAEPPSEVRERMEAATQGLCDAYDKDPLAYAGGETTFSFDSALYAHASLKEALKKAQHDKCCFCESRVTHVSSGDVERAVERLSSGLIDELITTNTVPVETKGMPIKVLSVASLLGQAISRINSNESITSLFRIKGF